MAIGLQPVDRLTASDCLNETAKSNIAGFDITNDMFAKHSWYFRNALVRVNYKNALKGVDYIPIYLERFFRNLLLDGQWELCNRYLHINPTEEWRVQPNLADRTSAGQVDYPFPISADSSQSR